MNNTPNNHEQATPEGEGKDVYPFQQQQEDLLTIADGMEAYVELIRQVVKRMQEQTKQ